MRINELNEQSAQESLIKDFKEDRYVEKQHSPQMAELVMSEHRR
jgi:hypothetical protein